MTLVIFFVLAALLAAVLTAVARWVAKKTRRFGVPNAPIPTFGGPAMLAAFFCVSFSAEVSLSVGLWVGIGGMFVVGVLDDLQTFVPGRKFILTVIVAAFVVGLGVVAHVTGILWIDRVITLLWMVWMCHAFNVFDMADGLSAGGGAIAFLAFGFMGAGSWAFFVAAVLIGFLVHNVYPARIYMGDAGSLPFGFLLSVAAVVVINNTMNWVGVVGSVSVLTLPVFEAVFISVMRFAKGRPISQASRDHVAQRLVVWGRSDRIAVGMMWFMGIMAGLVGFAIVTLELSVWLFGGILVLVILSWWGLSRVDMEGDGCDGRPASLLGKNWMIHRLMRQAMIEVMPFASGRLLDVGCGQKPYAIIFGKQVKYHIGIERDLKRYGHFDVCGDVLALPFVSASFDTVLCNQVLEHVPEPQVAIDEMARMLKPGGHLILTAPHIWGLHEVPHDYFRYTPYGLRHLSEKSGFVVQDVKALAGFWVTAGARFCYYLARFDRGIFVPFVRVGFLLVQLGALVLDRLHRVESEAWNFLLIAEKK